MLRIDDALRERARYAYVHERGADVAEEERERRHEKRQRQTDAVRNQPGLGHDLRAGLLDPSLPPRCAKSSATCSRATTAT